jgi:hypothetical protein
MNVFYYYILNNKLNLIEVTCSITLIICVHTCNLNNASQIIADKLAAFSKTLFLYTMQQ